jgi:hypothetical protein
MKAFAVNFARPSCDATMPSDQCSLALNSRRFKQAQARDGDGDDGLAVLAGGHQKHVTRVLPVVGSILFRVGSRFNPARSFKAAADRPGKLVLDHMIEHIDHFGVLYSNGPAD